MSVKIDIRGLVGSHISTLSDTSGRKLKIDLFVFYALPVFFGLAAAILNLNIKPGILSLLVNVGAILTALLFAVLMQIYSQEQNLKSKIESKIINSSRITTNTIKLLQQLYSNICYSILCCIALVFLCIGSGLLEDKTFSLTLTIKDFYFNCEIYYNTIFFTPLIVFIFLHILLTMLMILKRMHSLLKVET